MLTFSSSPVSQRSRNNTEVQPVSNRPASASVVGQFGGSSTDGTAPEASTVYGRRKSTYTPNETPGGSEPEVVQERDGGALPPPPRQQVFVPPQYDPTWAQGQRAEQ